MSKPSLIFVFFSVTLVLSIIGMFVSMSIFHPTYLLSVVRLDQKPEQFMSLETLDRYVLQTINNPSDYVELRAIEDSQTYMILSSHNTANLEYNGNFYTVRFAIGDNFPSGFLHPLFLLVGIATSTIALFILSLRSLSRKIRNPKLASQHFSQHI